MLPFRSFLLSLSHDFLQHGLFITYLNNKKIEDFHCCKKKGPFTILLSFYFIKNCKNMACREQNTYIAIFSGLKISSTCRGQKGTFFDKSQFEKKKILVKIFIFWKYFAQKTFLLFHLFLWLPTFFPTNYLVLLISLFFLAYKFLIGI